MEDGSLQELPTDNPGRPCREDPGVGTSLDQSVPCAEVRGVSIASPQTPYHCPYPGNKAF